MSDLEQQLRVIDDEYILNQYKSKIDYYWGQAAAIKNPTNATVPGRSFLARW